MEQNNTFDLKKITAIVLILLVAVISFTVIAPWAASPDTHTHAIEQTEEKVGTVMTLSGGAAATSATLSLLPGDMCTPIAEQLAELAKYFLLILSALYLEKFMITITGYITFSFLIPLACLILCAALVWNKKSLKVIAGKVAIIGLVIYLIVPASVKLSDMIYDAQSERIESTITEYNELEIDGDSEDGFFNEFTTITTDTVDRVTAFIESLMESLAVMIVASCIVPILVFVLLVWMVKTIFGNPFVNN